MALFAELCECLFALFDSFLLPLDCRRGLFGAQQSGAAGYSGVVAAYIMQDSDSSITANKQVFSACVEFHVVYYSWKKIRK